MAKKKIDPINLLALLFAVLAFLYSTIKSCSTDREIKKVSYKLASLENRPRLKLSNPEIIAFNLYSNPFETKYSPADSTLNVFAKIDLKVKLKVTNIGSHTAKIIGWAISDTNSEEQIIKKWLSEPIRINKNSKNSIKFPFENMDVNSLDSAFIEVQYEPIFFKNKTSILHVLIFYENEIGQLFDTYYWLYLKTNDITIPYPNIYINNSVLPDKDKRKIIKFLELKQENNISSIYSEEEKIIFFEKLKKL